MIAAKVSPQPATEIKLLFELGVSAMMVHKTNTMCKTVIPGTDDFVKQNPDLMKQFQTAAVNSLEHTSPGLSGFMNNVMNAPQDRQSQQSQPQVQERQEMKGPSDVSDILSNIKSKTINIPNNQSNVDNSTISISDLKEMNNSANLPKKSSRRKKSNSNTISLQI